MQRLRNKIICGDCIEVLSKIDKPFADLIFADPPFNIGFKYDRYKDKVKKNRYVAWTKDWMSACKKVLKPHGSFYIAIGDEYAADVKIIADKIGLFMRNWIIWHYTFGQQTKDKFARSHTHIFYFVNDKKNFTFNDFAVRVPSDRQLLYNDKRANPKGKMPDDVWDTFPRVCGTFKERTGWHPCQMPESLLARIIRVSSNQADCVLDPFVGSGTTAVVANEMKRNYTGIDVSENYVENTIKRLKEPKDEIPKNLSLTAQQLSQIKQLLSDIARPAREILGDANLLRLFTSQLAVRMNNQKKLQPENIIAALRDLAH